MNQAFYIGGKINVNPDARIVGTFFNCCKSHAWQMKISSISVTDSVNFTVMFKHVTAINYK